MNTLDLKKQIKSFLKYYECKDFLEMAEIINVVKIFVGNLSFGFTIAEGQKNFSKLFEFSSKYS